jgi:hypothetical protein
VLFDKRSISRSHKLRVSKGVCVSDQGKGLMSTFEYTTVLRANPRMKR